MIGHHSEKYSSVADYIRGTNMDRNGTRGTDFELITASHMLNTSLSMYFGLHTDPIMLIDYQCNRNVHVHQTPS